VLAVGTVWGSSSRFLVEFLLERYELYAHIADFVGQEYTHGGDIRFMIENLEEYRFVRPTNPDPGAHQYEVESWKKTVRFVLEKTWNI